MRVALTSILALALLSPVVAMAQPETPVGIVSTDGIDLRSPAGQAELRARVRHEVNLLCGMPVTRELTELNDISACRVRALRATEAQVTAAIRASSMTAEAAPVRVSEAR